MNLENGINVLSLFDGASCGRIALERAGINVDKYYASEINESAIKVSNFNYPNIIQLGDVIDLDCPKYTKIDLLIGGSPCQDLRPGRDGLLGQKSKLFYEYLRILNEIKLSNPNVFFLLENVYKISSDDKNIISELLGVDPFFICSSSFSAQKRKRLYWTNIPFDKNIPKNTTTISDILISNIDKKLYLSDVEINRAHKKHSAQTYKTGNKMGAVKFPTPLNEKSKCINVVTIKADRASTHVVDVDGVRILSRQERELLQTWPIDYTSCVSDKESFNLTGNGWTVDVIAHIFKGLR